KYIMLSMIAGLFMSSGMQTVERHPGEYGEGETKARLIKKPAAKQSIQTELDYIFAADSVPRLKTFITKNPTFDWTSPQINLLFPTLATTPLMSAAYHNAIKCLIYLFNENIGNIEGSIFTKDSSGKTALDYAKSQKSQLAYNYLMAQKAKLEGQMTASSIGMPIAEPIAIARAIGQPALTSLQSQVQSLYSQIEQAQQRNIQQARQSVEIMRSKGEPEQVVSLRIKGSPQYTQRQIDDTQSLIYQLKQLLKNEEQIYNNKQRSLEEMPQAE
ncbi:MAG TPA: ankyrin repeat domain-containing protein, partial [Candidatus Saccharimonadales bacterium]|nr:ankyrin repeat domain-containing protein [Candidatus Saccharimonadales bacterium]